MSPGITVSMAYLYSVIFRPDNLWACLRQNGLHEHNRVLRHRLRIVSISYVGLREEYRYDLCICGCIWKYSEYSLCRPNAIVL